MNGDQKQAETREEVTEAYVEVMTEMAAFITVAFVADHPGQSFHPVMKLVVFELASFHRANVLTFYDRRNRLAGRVS